MPSAAENIKTKLERRVAETRMRVTQLERRRAEHPEDWPTTLALQLDAASSYLSGLELAYMIVLEETQ